MCIREINKEGSMFFSIENCEKMEDKSWMRRIQTAFPCGAWERELKARSDKMVRGA